MAPSLRHSPWRMPKILKIFQTSPKLLSITQRCHPICIVTLTHGQNKLNNLRVTIKSMHDAIQNVFTTSAHQDIKYDSDRFKILELGDDEFWNALLWNLGYEKGTSHFLIWYSYLGCYWVEIFHEDRVFYNRFRNSWGRKKQNRASAMIFLCRRIQPMENVPLEELTCFLLPLFQCCCFLVTVLENRKELFVMLMQKPLEHWRNILFYEIEKNFAHAFVLVESIRRVGQQITHGNQSSVWNSKNAWNKACPASFLCYSHKDPTFWSSFNSRVDREEVHAHLFPFADKLVSL